MRVLAMTTRRATPEIWPTKMAAHLFAFACACLMTAMLFAVSASAQDAPAAPSPAPLPSAIVEPVQTPLKAKSTLRGHVSYEGTGRPVRRARVMLLSKNKGSSEMNGVTNARGDFQIKNVTEGKYFVMVDAPGIVTPMSLVDLDYANGTEPDLSEIEKQFEDISIDGINDKEVEIHARRGGAISGRVAYQDGDPAISVRVMVFRRRNGELKQFLTNLSPNMFFGQRTDDRGMYRFAGLPPGEYVIAATENIEHGDARRNPEDSFISGTLMGINSLVVTYYQDATNGRDATAIKIEAGEEEKNIDITLAERSLHSIAGTVRSRRNQRPLVQARVTLTSKENKLPANQFMPYSDFLPSSETDESGQWSFSDIPDGDYVITIQPAYQLPEEATKTEASDASAALVVSHNRKKFSQKQQEIKVAGRDITNLVIELSEGARLMGTVVVEGGKMMPAPVYVTAQPLEEDSGGASRGMVSENGNFVMDGLPAGKVNLSINSADSRYYAKSITAGGVDLTREPLQVQESAEINNIRIILSADSGTLTGRILSAAGGSPAGGTRFALYPVDSALWSRPNRVIFQSTDEAGAFNISAPPGEYFFLVLRGGEHARAFDEAFVKARTATATRITLQANEQRSIEIIAPPPTN